MDDGPARASRIATRDSLLAIIRRHWGFDALRPLQEQAIDAVLRRQDSLLVLPTGGGKSLCYQAPAVLLEAPTVVISPLIALMKDQVDGLRSCGVSAVQLNSSLSPEELRSAEQELLEGRARLVFASPERMATDSFRRLLKRAQVRTFAIDEAHCISHWGHDFRPDYRQLKELKARFPEASVHAFTATATEQVRQDIVEQLGLSKPEVLVGNFDRPNLTYRVVPRNDLPSQVLEFILARKGEAGILYCLRRRDVDDLAALLNVNGIKAAPYHAGMTAEQRKKTHDRFSDEKCDVVVATVAFGMGIDRSNIRYVLHAGMPKSIEHYQQEAGRAGRDGLEAECVLLYSSGDAMTWKRIVQSSVSESETPVDPGYLENVYRQLAEMEHYCRPVVCRHKSLVEHFGQKFESENCGACDVCLDESEPLPDGQTIAKKILSCVFRVNESFGMAHVTAVLRGANTGAIRERGHEKLSTYGLLREHSQQAVRDWIQQLIGQGALELSGQEYPILKLNAASWEIMKDQRQARLRALAGTEDDVSAERTSSGKKRRTKTEADTWEGVDQELFEALRGLRAELSEARSIPPYIIFSDASLRDMARVRPSTLEQMRAVYGVGDSKLQDFGQAVLNVVDTHCHARQLSRDNTGRRSAIPATEVVARKLSAGASAAAELFREGASLDDVISQLGRSKGTVSDYLADYISIERPASIAQWVPDEVYRDVAAVIARLGPKPLKPIFLALNEKVPYEIIRIVAAHQAIVAASSNAS